MVRTVQKRASTEQVENSNKIQKYFKQEASPDEQISSGFASEIDSELEPHGISIVPELEQFIGDLRSDPDTLTETLADTTANIEQICPETLAEETAPQTPCPGDRVV